MKTILILAVSICGAVSVLYAALANAGASGGALPARPPVHIDGAANVAVGGTALAVLVHRFAPVNDDASECALQ